MALDVHELRSRAEAFDVLRVNGAAWREAYDFLPESALPSRDYRPDPSRVSEFYANVQERDAPVFVAVRDGEVVGFAELRWGSDETDSFVPQTDAELKALYVHPDAWGEGIGSELLVASLFAVPPTFERLTLQTFRENQPARAFYERHGFSLIDDAVFEIDGAEYPTSVYTRPVD